MISVLQLVAVWGSGGIEKNICNYIKYMNADKIHMDLMCFEKKGIFFDSILKESMVKIYTPQKDLSRGYIKKMLARIQFIYAVMKSHGYDIVHINMSTGVAFLYAYIIRKVCPSIKIFIHGHGDGIEPPCIKGKEIFYKICRIFWEKNADGYIACSEQINRWMYSEKVRQKKSNYVIHCAVDTRKYIFNPKARRRKRTELKIQDETLLIGTIARMEPQKNPFFLLNIIEQWKRNEISFQFLWIGEGELETKVKAEAKKRKLLENIIFYGISNEIPEMLSAMDIFLLPSLYEGLSIVNIEAQCAGLYTLVSDTTTIEAKISKRYEALSIENAEAWVEALKRLRKSPVLYDREYPEVGIREGGFDLFENVKEIQELYEKVVGEE